MSALLQQILKSRESRCEVQGVGGQVVALTVRRPSEVQMARLSQDGGPDALLANVVGWDATEAALVQGGGPHPVPFDPAAFRAWVDDSADAYNAVVGHMIAAFEAHLAARGTAEKN